MNATPGLHERVVAEDTARREFGLNLAVVQCLGHEFCRQQHQQIEFTAKERQPAGLPFFDNAHVDARSQRQPPTFKSH